MANHDFLLFGPGDTVGGLMRVSPSWAALQEKKTRASVHVFGSEGNSIWLMHKLSGSSAMGIYLILLWMDFTNKQIGDWKNYFISGPEKFPILISNNNGHLCIKKATPEMAWFVCDYNFRKCYILTIFQNNCRYPKSTSQAWSSQSWWYHR